MLDKIFVRCIILGQILKRRTRMTQFLVTGSLTLTYLVDAANQGEAIKKVIDRDNISVIPSFSVTEYSASEAPELVEYETTRLN